MTASRPAGWGMEALPRIVRGEGSYLYDAAGKRYLDGSGGPAAFSIGHGNAEVNAAIAVQLAHVACGYRYLFTSEPLEELTELLLARCGPGFGQVVYSGSGSEAVESALKIALQYWDARGLPHKKRFIARQRSYHGNTLGALSVSGFAERRRPFEGSLLDVGFVSPANAYRPLRGLAGAALVEALAAELDAKIRAIGPGQVAAFIFEPVVGAAGGAVPAPEGYARAVQAVCAHHGVLLIADEVMSGAGRCGTWRALEHDGVVPDLLAVGKGLAGGYFPSRRPSWGRSSAPPSTQRTAPSSPATPIPGTRPRAPRGSRSSASSSARSSSHGCASAARFCAGSCAVPSNASPRRATSAAGDISSASSSCAIARRASPCRLSAASARQWVGAPSRTG